VTDVDDEHAPHVVAHSSEAACQARLRGMQTRSMATGVRQRRRW
jgi:hypothetical protein